jgi:HAE1 family hydrophobic/amphiphilic exporter-1/multidrug efflux pump
LKSKATAIVSQQSIYGGYVSAGLAPGKSINDGIEAMKKITKKKLDDTFTTDLEGI